MPKTILIVDDHADIRRLLRMTLEFEDYEIFEAGDGEAALRFLAERHADTVLLDVMMPGPLNGLDVCRRIRAGDQGHKAHVLLLSARGQASDREAGLQAGADAYLVKPFSPLQLIECLAGLPALA
ncbi:response regulator transcription factor [Roseateles sp.]|uniref:response regulator transcription factor n=1 Tax=Roseateles sp. TaxID=1971397 RepID=UPI0039ED2BD1